MNEAERIGALYTMTLGVRGMDLLNVAAAVAIGITPDTLRAARRGRVLNGGTVTAITAYVSASTHTASERRAA